MKLGLESSLTLTAASRLENDEKFDMCVYDFLICRGRYKLQMSVNPSDLLLEVLGNQRQQYCTYSV